MAGILSRKPSGAYGAAYPVATDSGVAFADAVVLLDGDGNPAPASGNPATISSKRISVTTAPTALASLAQVNGAVFKAGGSQYGDTDAATIWFGGSDLTNTAGVVTNGYPILSGEAISYGVSNVSGIYVCTATGVGTLYRTGN